MISIVSGSLVSTDESGCVSKFRFNCTSNTMPEISVEYICMGFSMARHFFDVLGE